MRREARWSFHPMMLLALRKLEPLRLLPQVLLQVRLEPLPSSLA
jgi:hypothetical protein